MPHRPAPSGARVGAATDDSLGCIIPGDNAEAAKFAEKKMEMKEREPEGALVRLYGGRYHRRMVEDVNALLEGFARGERRALARVISLVENGAAPPLPAANAAQAARPMISVGITGSGGAGKSTLIAALCGHLRKLGRRVAVLASDPRSPRSGGALLGDRVRMQFDPADDGLYFRSMSTRGATGGISAAVPVVLPWLAAFGFDVALVETVGVGQDQAAVRDCVDVLVLLVTPHTGDEIQWEKAGVIELADIVAVNKSDLPGADRVRQQLRQALTLSPDTADVPILPIVASTAAGVAELWRAIEAV